MAVKSCRLPVCAGAPDWAAVPVLALAPCRWSPCPPPETTAQGVWVPGTGLLFRMTAREASPRAENRLPDSPVWEDSCLECFLAFGDSGDYINMECNPRGALRCGFGPGRHGRAPVRSLDVPVPRTDAAVGPGRWEVLFTLPEATVAGLFGTAPAPGLLFRGNFYKCGDKTPRPHYAAWSDVETETPDFHRPEYFGTLEIG